MLPTPGFSDEFALSMPQIKRVFVGREEEIHIFVQYILKASEPLLRAMVIWGEAGIGKSTLLRRFYDIVHETTDSSCTFVAYADVQMATPLTILKHWATQLRCAGLPLPLFEQQLATYQHTVKPWNAELEVARVALTHEPSHGKEVYIKGMPLLRGFYEQVAQEARVPLQENIPTDEAVLVQAFMDDLKWQAKSFATSHVQPMPQHRIILFCDVEGIGASRSIENLLPLLLQESTGIPLTVIIAQEKPIHIPALETKNLSSLQLAHFTEQEVHAYLETQGIVDEAYRTTLHQFSMGLPLSLRLLLLLPEEQRNDLHTTEAILQRWLMGLGDVSRQAVLKAALFSCPFTQDDFAAFYPQKKQQIACYRWLTGLPFVQHSPHDGRHYYHWWVQEKLCQYFLQSAPQQYYVARRALARYYRRELQTLRQKEDQQAAIVGNAYAAALLVQLLALPDEESHLEAAKLMLYAQHATQQNDAIDDMLYTIDQHMPIFQLDAQSRQMVDELLPYFRNQLTDAAWLASTESLFAHIDRVTTFPQTLLALMYCRRSAAYMACDDITHATLCLEKALSIDPACCEAYLLRGMVDIARQSCQQAVEAFGHVLTLEKTNSLAYVHRGIAFWKLKAYEQAIDDFDHAYMLMGQSDEIALLRSQVYGEMEMRGRGLVSLSATTAADTDGVPSDVLQGMAFYVLGDYQRAIEYLDAALMLKPTQAQAYALRGYVYLAMGEIARGREDLQRSQTLSQQDDYLSFLLIWLALCQGASTGEQCISLEKMVASSQDASVAALCRGVVALLREQYAQAYVEFDQATALRAGQSDTIFWKGLACAFLGYDDEATAAFKQVATAELPLPAVFFTPLRWLELKYPERYHSYGTLLYKEHTNVAE